MSFACSSFISHVSSKRVNRLRGGTVPSSLSWRIFMIHFEVDMHGPHHAVVPHLPLPIHAVRHA
jgi:hypothetical protein